jgi:hypothetical protein
MFSLFLFAKKIHNQTEKDAEKNAGCQREVKGDVAAPDPEISRKAAQIQEVPQETRRNQHNPRYNQDFAHPHIFDFTGLQPNGQMTN